MTTARRQLIVFLTGAGLTMILAGLLPFIAAAQETTPEATATLEGEPPAEATAQVYDLENVVPVEPSGDNSYCIVCHNQPLHTVTMQDGNILNLYVNPDIIANSVHGAGSETGTLGCIDCHGADSFPHNGPTPTDQRAYSLRSVSFCLGCHSDEVDALQNGLHEQAILAGDTTAAVCTDCHGAHDIQPVEEFPELVAGVCGDCHESTLGEWRASAHVDIGPLDCATCHSPHSQRLRVGETTDDLCMNCHKDMPEIFSHTQHTGSGDSTVACIDCHMIAPEPAGADAQTVSDERMPYASHSMLVETFACNTCHEEMVVSGEWAQFIGDADILRAERAELQARIADLESSQASVAAAGEASSYLQLIQGLILGIGFGITAAAVFIARGNRRA